MGRISVTNTNLLLLTFVFLSLLLTFTITKLSSADIVHMQIPIEGNLCGF